MNIWGALFLAPVVALAIISPLETLPVLAGGALAYGALLWVAHRIIGRKPPH